MTELEKFRRAINAAVEAVYERVVKCPQCGSLFLKDGKRKFCGSRCAQRAGQVSFWQRHRRDYRQEYRQRKASARMSRADG